MSNLIENVKKRNHVFKYICIVSIFLTIALMGCKKNELLELNQEATVSETENLTGETSNRKTEENTEREEMEIVEETEAVENTLSAEENETVYLKEDYGVVSENRKDYYNDIQENTYYYEIDEFYFAEDKYAVVNKVLQQIYAQIESEYEEEAERYIGSYELDSSIENEAQKINYCEYICNGLLYVGDDYVSLLFNNCIYWEGAAHPYSYFDPVTINVRTGEIVTPEEVLGIDWETIREQGNIGMEDEEVFSEEYGFYITDRKLVYIYRTNVFVDTIEIER